MFSNGTTSKLFADDLKLYIEHELNGRTWFTELLVYQMATHYFDEKMFYFFVRDASKMHQEDLFINTVCLPSLVYSSTRIKTWFAY